MTATSPLTAPLTPAFDYTRSLGPVLGPFMTGLRDGRVLGVRGSDGRVLVPPAEYDPVTADPLSEFVEVAPTGTVTTWSWQPDPLDGQPLDRPFAWALILLDGADTPMLHAVDVPHDEIRTGLRVRVRWAESRVGSIRDIACFERSDGSEPDAVTPVGGDDVTQVITPVQLAYTHSASHSESSFLRAIAEGRLIGQRCPVCRQVYAPARGACPVDGVPVTEEIELADTGTVTTFCIVNVPFAGQRITPPYVSAYVVLDGADIALQHLVLEIPAEEVRMGLRVQAVWRPREEWGHTLENISHFKPSGEPDAAYETYSQHL